VITDHLNHILSTGYNGVPSGQPHCIDFPCEGIEFPSGYGLDLCKAQHAEVNAIVQCRDLQSANTIYITVSPCMSCMKMIAATNIRKIVTKELYSEEALDYWLLIGGVLVLIN
jgi:dCMP deaminase